MVDFGRIWWATEDAPFPPTENWARIEDCHEWDGLFSIRASIGTRRLLLTAFCDNAEAGKFTITENGDILAEGVTRVSQAPAIIEDDGYMFPAGADFGAGTWKLECKASSGQCYRVIAEVRHWVSTD